MIYEKFRVFDRQNWPDETDWPSCVRIADAASIPNKIIRFVLRTL